MASAAERPRFEIKNRFQKGGLYEDLLTPAILSDVCRRLTGRGDYNVHFDNSGYNIGRLATLKYEGITSFISFSEKEIRSRNSSFQSFPSALSRYILNSSKQKQICFYIHPDTSGNFETEYFTFMYRLMKTVGVNLLNIDEHVSKQITPFSSPEELINQKNKLRSRTTANNSTYITTGEDGVVQVYAKTYGANKYESTLICISLVKISPTKVELYEVEEGGLKSLPLISKQAILASGEVTIATSTIETEIASFNENNSLRSIKFIYNLLEKFGKKSCAFCECEIPQIIQGAHIWPVAAIKQQNHLSQNEKLALALDGQNGLWLCENHHKLLDSGTLFLASSGALKYRDRLSSQDVAFLKTITPIASLPAEALNPTFLDYVKRRNSGTVESAFLDLS